MYQNNNWIEFFAGLCEFGLKGEQIEEGVHVHVRHNRKPPDFDGADLLPGNLLLPEDGQHQRLQSRTSQTVGHPDSKQS